MWYMLLSLFLLAARGILSPLNYKTLNSKTKNSLGKAQRHGDGFVSLSIYFANSLRTRHRTVPCVFEKKRKRSGAKRHVNEIFKRLRFFIVVPPFFKNIFFGIWFAVLTSKIKKRAKSGYYPRFVRLLRLFFDTEIPYFSEMTLLYYIDPYGSSRQRSAFAVGTFAVLLYL